MVTSATEPTLRRPRRAIAGLAASSSRAGRMVIRASASRSDRTPRSRTYRPSTRLKQPAERGWLLWCDSKMESEPIITHGAARASVTSSSLMANAAVSRLSSRAARNPASVRRSLVPATCRSP